MWPSFQYYNNNNIYIFYIEAYKTRSRHKETTHKHHTKTN